MGFSLRRALAGAVAGGAGAAVELADNAIKGAEHDRQQAEAFQRQKELLQLQEESAVRREGAVLDLKEKRENNRKERVGKFMQEGLDQLKEEGLSIGSIAGQYRLAELAARNGHQDYADKFSDNAIKMGQIDNDKELKKMQMQVQLETSRMARESRAANRIDPAEKDQARVLALADAAGKRVQVTDREGNSRAVPDASNQLQALALEGFERGMPNNDVRQMVTEASSLMNRAIARNPNDPMKGVIETYNFVRGKNKWAEEPTTEKKSEPPPATTTSAPPAADKKVIDPALGRRSAAPVVTPVVFGGFDEYGNRKEPGVSVAGADTPSTFQIGTGATHDRYGNRIKY